MMAKATDHLWSFDEFYEIVISGQLGFGSVALAGLFPTR
jgi:hypothetical protein